MCLRLGAIIISNAQIEISNFRCLLGYRLCMWTADRSANSHLFTVRGESQDPLQNFILQQEQT